MKLALSTVTYLPYCGLETALERASKLGFDRFEIPGERPQAFPKDLRETQRANVRKLLNDRGLTAEIVTVDGSYLIGPGFCSEDQDIRRDAESYIRDLIELGHDLGSSKLIMLPGRPLITTDKETGYELAVEGLRRCADHAKGYGITICIENTPYPTWLLDTPDKIMGILRDVSATNLAVRLDPCHCNVSKTNFRNFCLRFKGMIKSAGIHDNKGDADSHLPIGQGNVDIESAISMFKEVQYDGSVTLEILPYEPWTVDEAERHIAESRSKLEKILRG